jgi:hypothetical protein
MREPFFAPLGLLRLAMVAFVFVVMTIWGQVLPSIIDNYGLSGWLWTMACLFGIGFVVDRLDRGERGLTNGCSAHPRPMERSPLQIEGPRSPASFPCASQSGAVPNQRQ